MWAYLSLCDNHSATVDQILAALGPPPVQTGGVEKKTPPGRSLPPTGEHQLEQPPWGLRSFSATEAGQLPVLRISPMSRGDTQQCLDGAAHYLVGLADHREGVPLRFLDAGAEEIHTPEQVALCPCKAN